MASKHDANAPINVSADKFVADSNAKTGTWTGNVVVIQGDMRMRANTVRLNVVGKDNKPDKIFANGNVVVDSPNSGTVTGDNGVYDVVAHTVTMTGKVVLTQGKGCDARQPADRQSGHRPGDLGRRRQGARAPSAAGGRVQGIFTPPPRPPRNSPATAGSN